MDARDDRSPAAVGDEHAPDPRTLLANERTFLAWNRTALALVAGGLAAARFLNVATAISVCSALALIACGAFVSIASWHYWRRIDAAIRAGDAVPPSGLPRVLAVAVVVFCVLAGVLAVLIYTSR
jgi:putative membrane protein